MTQIKCKPEGEAFVNELFGAVNNHNTTAITAIKERRYIWEYIIYMFSTRDVPSNVVSALGKTLLEGAMCKALKAHCVTAVKNLVKHQVLFTKDPLMLVIQGEKTSALLLQNLRSQETSLLITYLVGCGYRPSSEHIKAAIRNENESIGLTYVKHLIVYANEEVLADESIYSLAMEMQKGNICKLLQDMNVATSPYYQVMPYILQTVEKSYVPKVNSYRVNGYNVYTPM